MAVGYVLFLQGKKISSSPSSNQWAQGRSGAALAAQGRRQQRQPGQGPSSTLGSAQWPLGLNGAAPDAQGRRQQRRQVR